MASIPPSSIGQPGSEGTEPSPISRFMGALAVSPRAFQLPAKRSAWLVPLLIVILIQIMSGLLLHDLVVKQTQEQQSTVRAKIQDDPQMSAEQKEQALERMDKFSGPGALRIWMVLGSIVSILFINLLLAAVLLLVLNFFMGQNAKFGGLWFLAALGWAPRAVESILFTLMARLSSKLDITFGPGAFFPAESAGRKFAGVISIFDFWMIAVLIVGVQVVTGTAKRKATTAVVGIWIAWWILRLGLAAIGNAMNVRA